MKPSEIDLAKLEGIIKLHLLLDVKLPFGLVCSSVGRSVGRSVCRLVGCSYKISKKCEKFHFHALIAALVQSIST